MSATFPSLFPECLDARAQRLEPNPQQQAPAADVFEFLLDFVDEFSGGAREARAAVLAFTDDESSA
jgi:hypothetical protein